MYSAVCTSAFARCSVDASDIACLKSDKRTSVFAESCENKFTCLTGFKNFTCVDVNSFNEDVVFSNVQTVVVFALCCTSSEYIRKTVEIVNLSSPEILDSLSCCIDRTAKFTGNYYLLDIEVFLRRACSCSGGGCSIYFNIFRFNRCTYYEPIL